MEGGELQTKGRKCANFAAVRLSGGEQRRAFTAHRLVCMVRSEDSLRALSRGASTLF